MKSSSTLLLTLALAITSSITSSSTSIALAGGSDVPDYGAAGSGPSGKTSAAPLCEVEIDATQLVYRDFVIPGVVNTWTDSRVVQTLQLVPGTYAFQVGSGYYADFTFDVGANCLVSYDEKFAGFLSGWGTDRLTLDGYQVTLDARYISGSGVLLSGMPMTNQDWITHRTVRMVPASYYSVQQGSGVVVDFLFRLEVDGAITYDLDNDVANGGFVSGYGTSTLEFFGYPILIDARKAGGTGATIQPIWGMPYATTSVLFANLLPAASFSLQVQSGVVSNVWFWLDQDGAFGFNAAQVPYLKLDSFNGLTRMTVLQPLP